MVEKELWEDILISKNHFGFMCSRLTTKAIYLIRRLMELYRKGNLHLVFLDLEKAYNRVLREVLCRNLEKKGVSLVYIRVIKGMYDGDKMSVRTLGGVTNDFPIVMGLHRVPL